MTTHKFLTSKQIILRIITIIAVVEFSIMDAFIFMDLGLSPYIEAAVDITLLSLFSAPLIYAAVINPYIRARDELLEQLNQMCQVDHLKSE